jgi:hypothetical protein
MRNSKFAISAVRNVVITTTVSNVARLARADAYSQQPHDLRGHCAIPARSASEGNLSASEGYLGAGERYLGTLEGLGGMFMPSRKSSRWWSCRT